MKKTLIYKKSDSNVCCLAPLAAGICDQPRPTPPVRPPTTSAPVNHASTGHATDDDASQTGHTGRVAAATAAHGPSTTASSDGTAAATAAGVHQACSFSACGPVPTAAAANGAGCCSGGDPTLALVSRAEGSHVPARCPAWERGHQPRISRPRLPETTGSNPPHRIFQQGTVRHVVDCSFRHLLQAGTAYVHSTTGLLSLTIIVPLFLFRWIVHI